MTFFDFLRVYEASYEIEMINNDAYITIKTRLFGSFTIPVLAKDIKPYPLYSRRNNDIFIDSSAESKFVKDAIKYINNIRYEKLKEKSMKKYVNYGRFSNNIMAVPLVAFVGIKKVIFNDPATIVIWEDDTKTVAKCHGDDVYDKTTGLLICIAKRYLGGTSKLVKLINKWVSEEEFAPLDTIYFREEYRGPVCNKCKAELDSKHETLGTKEDK